MMDETIVALVAGRDRFVADLMADRAYERSKLLSKDLQWIPVEEQLPDTTREVLARLPKDHGHEVLRYVGGNWYQSCRGPDKDEGRMADHMLPTHWKEIPK